MPVDYKDYPPNWKTEIRPAILQRAENKCEDCGVENHRLIHRFGKGQDDWVYYPEGMEAEAWSIDGKKATKIVLTIAHVDNPDKMDCRPENLKALCQKCHLQRDMAHHIANRKKTLQERKKQSSLF